MENGDDMTLEQELLMNRFPDFARLKAYGFTEREEGYVYETSVGDGDFDVQICFTKKGNIIAHVTDVFTGEEYVQIRTAGRRGTYAAKIRQEYLQILEEIAGSCCFVTDYLLPQSYRTAEMIRSQYGQQAEAPFSRFPQCFTFGQDRDRWYALIMSADASQYMNREGRTEILEVRCEGSEREELLQKSGYVRPQRMKKGSWIGILMEEILDDGEIAQRLEKSRRIAEGQNQIREGRREWIYPANPKYFDLDHGFSVSDQLYWKQSSKVDIGDYVYIYYGMPFGSIRYLCEVTEKDIPNRGNDDGMIRMETLMRLRRLKFYDGNLVNRSVLRQFGFTNFRGPRYMSKELKEEIERLYGSTDPGKEE